LHKNACYDEFYQSIRGCVSHFGHACVIEFDEGCLAFEHEFKKEFEEGASGEAYAKHIRSASGNLASTHMFDAVGGISTGAQIEATVHADVDFKLNIHDPGFEFTFSLHDTFVTAEAWAMVELEVEAPALEFEDKVYELAKPTVLKKQTFIVEGFPINVDVEVQPVAVLSGFDKAKLTAGGGLRISGWFTLPGMTATFGMGAYGHRSGSNVWRHSWNSELDTACLDDCIQCQDGGNFDNCLDHFDLDRDADFGCFDACLHSSHHSPHISHGLKFGVIKNNEYTSIDGHVLVGLKLSAVINGLEVYAIAGLDAGLDISLIGEESSMTGSFKLQAGADVPEMSLADFFAEQCETVADNLPECASAARDMMDTACHKVMDWMEDKFHRLGWSVARFVPKNRVTVEIGGKMPLGTWSPLAPLHFVETSRRELSILDWYTFSVEEANQDSGSLPASDLSDWEKFYHFTHPTFDGDYALYEDINVYHEEFRAKHCIDVSVTWAGAFDWYVENSWCARGSTFCCIMGGVHEVICDNMPDSAYLEIDGQRVCDSEEPGLVNTVRISGTGAVTSEDSTFIDDVINFFDDLLFGDDDDEAAAVKCDGTMVGITVTPGWWPQEMSWSVKDAETNEEMHCSQPAGTYDDQEFWPVETLTCCLPNKPLTVVCEDSFGDGWHGGFLRIAGQDFCDYFADSISEEPLDLTTSCETGTRLFNKESCLAMTGCCWNDWAFGDASFGLAGRCHDANEFDCAGAVPEESPAEDTRCILNNEHEWSGGDWETTTGSINWIQFNVDVMDFVTPCVHSDLQTSGHHVVQATLAVNSIDQFWLIFNSDDSMWVDSLELEMGNYNHLWGANGVVGLCLSNEASDVDSQVSYYLQFTGCCEALRLDWDGHLTCYQPGWTDSDELSALGPYDEMYIREDLGLAYSAWFNRRRLSGNSMSHEEERQMIASFEEDIASHPEHLVDITAMAEQGKELGVQYTRTILDRALGEKSESIKAALRENGFEEVAEYINSFPAAQDLGAHRPTVSDEEVARFLGALTSDATDDVVAAIVDAKFPEKTRRQRFLRAHFAQGALLAMEREYTSSLASFAEAKSLLPADSELLDLFW